MQQVARSLFFYTTLFLSTIFLGILAILTVFITRRGDLAHLYGRLWSNVNLWAAGVRVIVRGLENIDPKSSYVYASNHQGWFDIFSIMGKLPVQFRWLAKEELYRIPILGQAMRLIGYIPINRSNHRKAFESLMRAAERVREGVSIVIFPEGTRSPDGTLQEFKGGGFVLAIISQRPIVPISLSGSYRILSKKGRRWINPGTVIMTIGKPIETKGLSMADRGKLMIQVREAIRENLTPSEGGVLSQIVDEPGSLARC